MNLQKTALFVLSKCIVLDARHDWWAWLSWFCTYYDGKNGHFSNTPTLVEKYKDHEKI